MTQETETIGLPREQRSDFDLRTIFVEAFDLVVPFLNQDGSWISLTHECMAQEALQNRFPDMAGVRLFAVIGSLASVRSTGRRPVN